ncbi:AAA family ATPase [Brachybacterium sp. J144]|uniref:nSTAND1 domain-containing NTPase n=1 Tax=Brachybacterium sp. J144 TaxID=3116487 RepID=UPI002E7908AD|nr:AAA family ATPase [Brachybacterium sp. J144]MEE1649980.1 AAA family ATPase [Brachybacterium sp. J144]
MDPQPAADAPRALLDAARRGGPDGVIAALAEARETRGLSYRALGKAVAISPATLQGWLTGKYAPQLSMRSEFEKLVVELGLTDPPGAGGAVTSADWWEVLRSDAGRKRAIPSPYPGMRSYGVEMAAAFVGREELIAALHDHLGARLHGDESPLLLVTGRSGVGKSSVVAAAIGTLPAPSGEPVRREVVTPGVAALDALDRLRGGELDVLVIDHAETLWTALPAAQRDELLERLAALEVQSRGVALVLVLRADQVAPATDVAVLRRALENAAVVVGPITAEDMARIITEPPARHGIAVEAGLAEIILRDAGARSRAPAAGTAGDDQLVGVLPLLSQTMRGLWLDRERPDRIGVDDYLRGGGLARSVEVAAETAHERLGPAARARVWPVLREMIRSDAAVPTRRSVPSGLWTDAASQEVLRVFLEARLLTSDADGLTLSHDLLLTAWPRLGTWLATAQEWTAARQLLHRFATFWDESGRPADLLASKTAAVLLEAQEQSADALAEEQSLSLLEREFLEVSRDAREAALRAAAADNRRLRRSRRRFGIVAGVASALLVVAVVAAGTAMSIGRSLDREREAALAGQIALYAEAAAGTMPAEAAQLAVGAHALDDNPATRSQLASRTASPMPHRILTPAGPGALATAGDLLVKVGQGGTIGLFSTRTGEPSGTVDAPASHLYAAHAVDVDGRLLLAAAGEEAEGSAAGAPGCVWDVTAEPRLLGCTDLPAKSDAVAVLPDGSGVLFGADDGTIQRLALDADGSVRPLPALEGPRADEAQPAAGVRGLAVGPSGVLVAAYDGSVALLADPLGAGTYRPVAQLPGLLSIAVSPDGTRYAASTRENSLVLGDVAVDGTIAAPSASAAFASWVNEAVFLPDGRVAAVSSDQTLRILAADGTELQVQETAALLTSVVADGDGIATYSVDGLVYRWPADALPDVSGRGRLFEVVSGREGQQVTASVGEDDGVLRVERLAADGSMRPLDVPAIAQRTSYGIALSADESLIATGGWDGDLYLWAVGETALSEPLFLQALPAGSLITYVTFSPDGRRLAVAAQNHDEVLVLDVVLGEPGAPGTLRESRRIPVEAGGTMTFLDPDTLVLDNGRTGLEIWDLAAGTELGEATVDGARPGFVLARPGHPGQVAYTTGDLSVGILDLSDPSAPRVISRIPRMSDSPLSLDFTPDGSLLAIAAVGSAELRSVDPDGGIAATGLTLTGPWSAHITDVAFLDGGTRLAASTYSGRIWRWDLEPDRAAGRICERTGAPLTTEAARSLAPSLPEDAVLCE